MGAACCGAATDRKVCGSSEFSIPCESKGTGTMRDGCIKSVYAVEAFLRRCGPEDPEAVRHALWGELWADKAAPSAS